LKRILFSLCMCVAPLLDSLYKICFCWTSRQKKKGIFLLFDASDLPRDILQFVLQERKERVFEKEPIEKHTSKEREREEREREKEERDPRSKILARTLQNGGSNSRETRDFGIVHAASSRSNCEWLGC